MYSIKRFSDAKLIKIILITLGLLRFLILTDVWVVFRHPHIGRLFRTIPRIHHARDLRYGAVLLKELPS